MCAAKRTAAGSSAGLTIGANEGSPSPWGQFTEWNQTELKHPFRWVRQFAFVKDAQPDGPAYLVIADDLTGNHRTGSRIQFLVPGQRR